MPDVVDTLGALHRKLVEHADPLDRYLRYLDGRAGLMYATEKFRTAFDNRLAGLCANYCGLVVQVLAERLEVVGFRVGQEEGTSDRCWDIWQRCNLDEGAALAILDALTLGRSYLMVWGDDEGRAQVTVESPTQCWVAHDPATRERVAAIKAWGEPDGDTYAVLYLPDAVHRFVTRSVPGSTPSVWERRGEPIPNPLGVVPVVPLINRHRLLDFAGRSELADVIPLQDLLNRLLADLVVAAEHVSLPRRWVTGVELETDPETGAPMEPFSAVGRLWQAESEAARFGNFPQDDFQGILAAIETTVQQIGTISGIPPHFLLSPASRGGPSSAESIKSSEASLIQKVRRRQLSFGAAFEEAMRLALAVEEGTVPAGAEAMETVWANPETRSEAQQADAAQKRKDLGVPFRQLAEDLGYTPTQIERMMADRAADGLNLDVLLRGNGS